MPPPARLQRATIAISVTLGELSERFSMNRHFLRGPNLRKSRGWLGLRNFSEARLPPLTRSMESEYRWGHSREI